MQGLRRFPGSQAVSVRHLPGPVLCLTAESADNWILFYVGELVRQLRLSSYAVIEEVVLPDYAVHPSVISLPPLNCPAQAIFGTELQKGVEMVGHQQEEKAVPPLDPNIGPHRLQNRGRKAWQCQRFSVLAAATDPDMKYGAIGYPSRDFVGKARRVVLHAGQY